MVRSQFASGRNSLDPITAVAESGGGVTSGKAGTYYLWVQGRNAIGYNLPSVSESVTVAAGQRIRVTFPSSLYGSGEAWKSFYLSGSTVDNPSTATVLAVLPVPNGSADLPSDILLSQDSHLEFNGTVTAENNLPTTNLIDGMLRRVNSLSRVFRYDSSSTATANGSTVLTAPTGRWLEFVDGFNIAGITDTTDPTGCDQDISTSIDNTRVDVPSYAVDGSVGPTSSFWVVNDSSDVIPKGTRVGLSVLVNNIDNSSYFDGFLKLVFKGYSNLTTGVLDILDSSGFEPMPNVDTVITYQSGKSSLLLNKDLPVNQAFQVDVYPQFSASQLSRTYSIPYNATISVYPFLYNTTSLYNEAGSFIGDTIYNTEARRRLVPDNGLIAKALSGSGIIKNYSFNAVGESLVPGLTANTANQKALIDGNGTVYIGAAPSELEAIRAIISTEAFTNTTRSSPSSLVSGTANPSFDITIDHPVLSGNTTKALIRNSYPDVIAGLTGYFNPTGIRVFITNTTTPEIRYFDVGVVQDETQQVTLNWASGTVIGSLPSENNNYGFYEPQQITTISTTAGSENYTLSYCYTYNGNAISHISHSTADGAITELSGSLLSLLEGQIVRPSVSDINALKAVSSPEDGEVRLVYSDVNGLPLWFVYRANSTKTANDIDVIQPTVITGNGRYEAIGSSDSEDNTTFLDYDPGTTYNVKTGPSAAYYTPSGGTRSLYRYKFPSPAFGVTPDTTTHWYTVASDGYTPITENASSFTQPNSGSNVTVTVVTSLPFAAGQYLIHSSGNYYVVVSKPSSTQLTLQNPIDYIDINAAASTTVPTGTFSVTGTRGRSGALIGIPMFYDTGTVDVSGDIKVSGGSISLSENDGFGQPISLSEVRLGSIFYLQAISDPTKYIRATLTQNLPTTGSVRTATVTSVSNGTFTDGEELRLVIARSGGVGFPSGFPMTYETGTVSANGEIQVSGGNLVLHQNDSNGLALPLTSVLSGSVVTIYKESNPSNYIRATLTSNLPSSGTTRTVAVTSVTQGSIADEDAVRVDISRVGATGPAGADGLDGVATGHPQIFTATAIDANGEIRNNGGTIEWHKNSRSGYLLPTLGVGDRFVLQSETNSAESLVITITGSVSFSDPVYSAAGTVSGSITAESNVRTAIETKGDTGENGQIIFIRSDSTAPPAGNANALWIIENLAKTAYWDPAANGGSGAWIDSSGNTL